MDVTELVCVVLRVVLAVELGVVVVVGVVEGVDEAEVVGVVILHSRNIPLENSDTISFKFCAVSSHPPLASIKNVLRIQSVVPFTPPGPVNSSRASFIASEK